MDFRDFESLYTNGEISSLGGDEPLEPVATADADFGDLPTPIVDFADMFPQVEDGTTLLAERPEVVPTVADDDPSLESATTGESQTAVASEGASLLTTAGPKNASSFIAAMADIEGIQSEAEPISVVEEDNPLEVQHVKISVTQEIFMVEEDVTEDEVEVQRARSVASDGLDVKTDHGETPAAQDYSVIEEASDDENWSSRFRDEVDDGLEVRAHTGKTPAASVEFDVEEVTTEDRSTEVSSGHATENDSDLDLD